MVAGEGRATQGTPLLSRVEFAIFVSSGGAFDHGKKRRVATRELESHHTGERPSGCQVEQYKGKCELDQDILFPILSKISGSYHVLSTPLIWIKV